MKIKIKCKIKDCLHWKDGWCNCQELIFEVVEGKIEGIFQKFFSCASYKPK